jgi:hypothetical protein
MIILDGIVVWVVEFVLFSMVGVVFDGSCVGGDYIRVVFDCGSCFG